MLMLFRTAPMRLPPTFSMVCLARTLIACGYLRNWTTSMARSIWLTRIEASLTPMIGGESKKTKS